MGTNAFQTDSTCSASDLASTVESARTPKTATHVFVRVSTVSTGCLLLILSPVVWVLISVAECRRVSLVVTQPLAEIGISVSRRCHFVFSPRLYLHASPLDLDCVSHGGMENNFPAGARYFFFFASVNNFFSACPLAALLCSAQLSVNRREIMFIRARRRWCIPLTDPTPPSN